MEGRNLRANQIPALKTRFFYRWHLLEKYLLKLSPYRELKDIQVALTFWNTDRIEDMYKQFRYFPIIYNH